MALIVAGKSEGKTIVIKRKTVKTVKDEVKEPKIEYEDKVFIGNSKDFKKIIKGSINNDDLLHPSVKQFLNEVSNNKLNTSSLFDYLSCIINLLCINNAKDLGKVEIIYLDATNTKNITGVKFEKCEFSQINYVGGNVYLSPNTKNNTFKYLFLYAQLSKEFFTYLRNFRSSLKFCIDVFYCVTRTNALEHAEGLRNNNSGRQFLLIPRDLPKLDFKKLYSIEELSSILNFDNISISEVTTTSNCQMSVLSPVESLFVVYQEETLKQLFLTLKKITTKNLVLMDINQKNLPYFKKFVSDNNLTVTVESNFISTNGSKRVILLLNIFNLKE
jgi:hypothetical protein